MTVVSSEPYCAQTHHGRMTRCDGPDPDATRRVALDRSLAELSPVVFASLPRADQRRKGLMYLRGLLGARGRKSVRNIAAFLGDQVNDQGLHHFINDSTWEWAPMREALGRYLARRLPPQACVLHPMVIPKSGTHSVGVARTFSWERGQSVTAQQVIGVWGVSAHATSPLNWWLHLPSQWTRGAPGDDDPSWPERRAGQPTPEDSMVSAYLETAARLRLPECPVTLNAEPLDGIRVVSKLSAAGLRHITRIAQDTWLLPHDPALPGWGERPLQAGQIAQLAKLGRKRVALIPSGSADPAELVAAIRVRLPVVLDSGDRGQDHGDFLLLGIGRGGPRWPEELWLTDMTTVDLTALLRLVALSHRVEQSGMPRAERVGIRDFVGRSFAGWHRHATLASIAHAATELADHHLAA
ncbi:IS701 family transposase [Streptomyces spectabilis]|uniref:Syndecan 1 n=1 Tax=Streptomyces spectabilis TaxID=68270 RepID=A0A5P2XI36_STRST|nr:transposase [Streptomyces spectabilis]MBB5104539.1 syndecan 1 [Streptomyces spectabilis]MCI3905106.1 transposase [Streptomyces spectabilis]QEV62122.1 transposase [Streptomyces spectabilis]GGV00615.1 putative ISXo8 transposase [Streptomyces spectabilis]